MRARVRLLLLLPLVAGAAAAGEWTIERFEWTGSAQLASGIEIVNEHGEVRTRSWASDRIELVANLQSLEGDPLEAEVRVDDRQDPFRIEVMYAPRPGAAGPASEEMEKRRVDLTVIVPRNLPLEVRTRAGLLEVKGHGAAIDAATASGAMRLSGEGRIGARSRRGAIDATFAATAWQGVAEFETLTGDITLWLPADAAVTVEARTEGEISTDYSLDVRRPDGRAAKLAIARVGGGGPLLRASSVRGRIRLLSSR